MFKQLLKKTFMLCVAAIITIGQNAYAQPETLWTNTIGGIYSDRGIYVRQTSDGGFIITGFTQSYGEGSHDVWLIKTDALGDPDWTRTFGGSGYDCGYAVQQTSDGGYIITGVTDYYGAGNSDVWLIKTDVLGDSIWTKTFGRSGSSSGSSVQQTSDGGYIITGSTYSYDSWTDVWLIKTDTLGDTVWSNTFGGGRIDVGYSVRQTSDGGFIITGFTQSYGAGDTDVWLIKTNVSGDTVWTKTFGGSSGDEGKSVRQTSDGGYIITGYTYSYGAGDRDVWLIKTDASGDTVWTKIFGGSNDDRGFSIQQTSDGGYIITGWTQSYGAGSYDVWLIKTDASGDAVWTNTFGGGDDDYGFSVQQTSDGGFIIAGSTESYGAGHSDVWLIRLMAETGIEEVKPPIPMVFSLSQNYPNPFNTVTTFKYSLPKPSKVTLIVYNLLGKKVAELANSHQEPGYYQVQWDATGIASGIYFCRIQAGLPGQGEFSQTRKLILLK